ncbi:MAG: homoserine O-acetyltransferase [Acidimicrobiia bacterium]|nr:homoserine O-acetyltransferase [Acidimicrobiia bacterium]
MAEYGPDARTRWFDAGSVALESGAVVPGVRIAYRTWGRLSPSADNAILVCHALTGDANVDRWWGPVIGPGRALDTDRYFVVASNVIGGCYGSTGPTSPHPSTGIPWGPDFPAVTIRDMVAVQHSLVDHLGIRRLALVVGGSMGAMQALEWAIEHPDVVGSVAPIAVGATHSAWCIGISEAQRQAIQADPAWEDGRYDPRRPPAAGLAVARQIAMVSYRSPESFGERFGRDTNGSGFEVESYLRHQGRKLVARFDANTYVLLTRSMDSHDVGRDRGGVAAALGGIAAPTTVVGITSDVLYPVAEQRDLVDLVPGARYVELDIPHGHDGFLVDAAAVGEVLAEHLSTVCARAA